MSQTLLVYKEENKLVPKALALSLSKFKNMKMEVLNFSMFLGIIVLVVLHLVVANSVAITDYNSSAAKKNVEGLQVEIRNLNLELTKMRSVGFLQEISGPLNLVAIDKIQYVQSSPDTVALNQ